MYKKSKRAFEKSNEVMPGGVNSPVRAFKSVNGDPIFILTFSGSEIAKKVSKEKLFEALLFNDDSIAA